MRLVCLLAVSALTLPAAVRHVRYVDRTDYQNGASFGPAGPYERLVLKAEFAVDPKVPANRQITDIDLAPLGDDGTVSFSADVIVLKPRDPVKANGTLLFEVSNRGGMGMQGMFGDDLLLAQGYTLVWTGWQFDVPRQQALKLYPPVARNTDGSTITGWIRSQFIPSKRTTEMPLADRNHVPYEPLGDEGALTVRDRPRDKATTIPRAAWKFAANGTITMTRGFEPGKMYELVYRSQNPPVVGLGLAAVRDLVSYLRRGGASATSALGDQPRFLKRAIGFGTSQSGRFLRTFLYYGFNTDEKGRAVFDGVWPHVAGAGRGSFNLRFAQPSRDGHQFLNVYYPTDLFPFTDLPETDPETGATGGLLDRTPEPPKMFYTNGSYEYWGRAASLIHTTPDGKRDAPLAPNTRIYFLAGTQHGPGARPERNHTQNRANPANYRWTMRALLTAMNSWITSGAEPPASAYPRIDRGELAPMESFPFPGEVGAPRSLYHATRLDFSSEPPKIGSEFPQLVPKVSLEDGNEIAGVRSLDLRAPLATYAGWNLRSADIGAPDMLADMIGSFFPLARTRAERGRSTRVSIEERYPSRDAYLDKARAAAADLVRDRFLLEADVPRAVTQAGERWDLVMK